jgi:putative membrane protein
MNIKNRFSDQELEQIKAAVRLAEDKISGEIVPVFVEKSAHYTIANYRAGAIGAAFVFILIIIFDRYVPALAVYDPLMIFVFVALGGLMGSLSANFIAPVRRLMVGQILMDQATRKRAENAFLTEEVFNTRHRTGIMIFVSFFEREVIVMADRGISKVVEQKEWDKLVRGIIQNVRSGKVADGMASAIHRCGEILLEKGFVKTHDDVNELRDDLRMDNQ